MIGKYHLRVRNKVCDFSLTLDRKYTLIQGDSGTGKSIFTDLVKQYSRYGADSGIELTCEISVVSLISDTGTWDTDTWKEKLNRYRDAIFVIDAFDPCIRECEAEFSELAENSQAYFIILSRKTFSALSYDTDSIYEFVSVANADREKQAYTVKLMKVYRDKMKNKFENIPHKK